MLEGLGSPASPDIAKSDLPLWSPATFTNGRRATANVESVHALVLDIDADPIPSRSDLQAAFAGIQAIVHSSSSATALAPRWRGVVALSRSVTAHEYRHIWSVVTASLKFPVGPQAKDPSRAWYFPRSGPDGFFEIFAIDGAPLDVDGLLAITSPSNDVAEVTPKTPADAIASGTAPPNRCALAADLLGRAWPPTGRHAAQLALAGGLKRDGWSKEEALEFLCDVCRVAGDEDRTKRTQTIHTTWTTSSNTTGWTSLGAHVDAAVVSAARDLLAPDAEDRAAVRELFDTMSGAGPSGVGATAGEVPASIARDAHFSARIKRGNDWNEPYVRPPYLLEGLIPRATSTTFFAEGGSVKSWTAFALAICVATGGDWLGRIPVVQGKVIILDYEDGWAEFRRRKEILIQKNPELDLSNLEYLYAGPHIADPSLWVWLAEQGYTLVIIDALSAAMPSDADENDQRFAEGLKYAGRFVEGTGCTVVSVHHANKNGGMRGTSAIRDQSDVVFRFEPVSETDVTKRMRMVCDKPGPQKRPAPVNVELSDEGLTAFDDEVFAAGRNASKPPDARAAILLALANRPMAGYIEIAKTTGLSEMVVREALRLMLEAGDLIRGRGRRLYLGNEAAQRGRIQDALAGDTKVYTVKNLMVEAAASREVVERMLETNTLSWSSTDTASRYFIFVDRSSGK